MVNLFIMTTALSGGPACWVDGWGGSYEAARTMLEDLGTFDDIVWSGVTNGLVHPSVAFMASETAVSENRTLKPSCCRARLI